MTHQRQSYLDADMHGMVAKPIEVLQLIEVMERALDGLKVDDAKGHLLAAVALASGLFDRFTLLFRLTDRGLYP